jgi:hypothetical protein
MAAAVRVCPEAWYFPLHARREDIDAPTGRFGGHQEDRNQPFERHVKSYRVVVNHAQIVGELTIRMLTFWDEFSQVNPHIAPRLEFK